ncbi:hypothetical protein B9479_004919 [Cryptococcus floricola]|uniref:Bromodomain associated domain-containing protein n=1 Tax=Cryptococcus floricola TaxID=2591691 RepID=A0A5D3AVZ3_9TREE|nr:hypothetical protein B9479_004919 [Cryptococcus floricola]
MHPAPDAVLHLAALHALAAAGFASTSSAASTTLSAVTARYLRTVAAACVERAHLAGRGKASALDVAEALEDLGIHVGELSEWAQGQRQVVLESAGLSGLEDHLRDGLLIDEGMGEMRLVAEEDMPDESDEDEAMESDDGVKSEPGERESFLRSRSPDLSWLPPLPDGDAPVPSTQDITAPPPPVQLESAPKSIADRYRRPIPYASSQLSQAYPFVPPPPPADPPTLPQPTTSLPSLVATYGAIAADPSISLRQNDLRRQAAEILRRSIAPVDEFTPKDTLSTHLAPIRASPIVPSHSDLLPPKLIPVNPSSDGLLSSLVQNMSSPYLPPALRDRLTSLRPPVAQMRNDEAVLYGSAVRGPDDMVLAKTLGKQQQHPEAYLRRTWNPGPRGADKFGRRALPMGKKVVWGQEGESVPRRQATGMEEERKRDENGVAVPAPEAGPSGTAEEDAAGPGPLTIKIGSSPAATSPVAMSGIDNGDQSFHAHDVARLDGDMTNGSGPHLTTTGQGQDVEMQ